MNKGKSRGQLKPAQKSSIRKAKEGSRVTAGKFVNAANYGKVLSFIVRNEESETDMMVAASGSTKP